MLLANLRHLHVSATLGLLNFDIVPVSNTLSTFGYHVITNAGKATTSDRTNSGSSRSLAAQNAISSVTTP